MEGVVRRGGGQAGPGARGTPTVDGDNVYVVSGFGRLVTVGAKEGKATETIAEGKLFVRHGEVLLAYDIKAP